MLKEMLNVNYDKGNMYRMYYALCQQPKLYDKVNRKTMIEVIQASFKDSQYMISYISELELDIIRKIYNQQPIEENYLLADLFNRFILVHTNYETRDYIINPDICAALLPYIKNEKQIEGMQKYNDLMLGFVRYFGICEFERFYSLFQVISQTNYTRKEVFHHLTHSPYLSYHIVCENNCFFPYEYGTYEDILTERKQHEMFMESMDERDILAIGKYKLNIRNKKIKAMVDTIIAKEKSIYWQNQLIEDMLEYIHMGFSFETFAKTHYVKHLLSKEELKIIKNGFILCPSGALNGLNQKQYQKRLKEQQATEHLLQNVPQEYAHLSGNQANVFYKIYMSVLDFINQKYRVCPYLYRITQQGINPEDVSKIRKVFLEHVDDIDEFVNAKKYHLFSEEKEIARSFKQAYMTNFIIVKHEKDYTIIADENHLYAIKAARSNLDQILGNIQIPCFAELLLLPFKEDIVIDGVVMSMPISPGPEIRKTLCDRLLTEKVYFQLPTKH